MKDVVLGLIIVLFGAALIIGFVVTLIYRFLTYGFCDALGAGVIYAICGTVVYVPTALFCSFLAND